MSRSPSKACFGIDPNRCSDSRQDDSLRVMAGALRTAKVHVCARQINPRSPGRHLLGDISQVTRFPRRCYANCAVVGRVFRLSLPDSSIFVGWRCPEAHSANLVVIRTPLSRHFHLAADFPGLRRSGSLSQIINQARSFPEQFPRHLFAAFLRLIDHLRPSAVPP